MPARTRTTKPKAKTKTVRVPIFTWPFQSSRPHGGTIVTYTAQLNEDETLSCNCPGWIFAKKGQERSCKHTRKVEAEVKDVLKAFKNGEELPLLVQESGNAGFTMAPAQRASKEGRLPFGRVVDNNF